MDNRMRFLALAAVALLVGEARAQAQVMDGQRAFVNVNVGVQLSDRSITTSDSFALYDEEATVSATQPVSGGVLFDVGGGVRVWEALFVGVAVNIFSDEAPSTVTASIPDPLVFENPLAVTLTQPGLTRREVGTHLQVSWVVPVAEQLDVTVFAGPSFVRLTQEFVTTVAVALPTQNATVVVADESGTGAGFNVGVDGLYLVTPNVGAGAFVRYVRATVDLDSLPDAKASSVQLGVGARLRF